MSQKRTEIATLGAGCYWCVEAVLQQVDGVLALRAGFMGGDVEDPSYEAVCYGVTGHAEVVEVSFDPDVISYRELLGWFWRLHDPTTLNRQGGDEGTQYRSVIFYHSEGQAADARESLGLADASGVFKDPIVTEVGAASTFWPAKDDHQDYYRQNKNQGYCHMVIRPKLEKLGLADASGVFKDPIVTEVVAASEFWPAKDDHQDYYRQNKTQGYCHMVIRPKLEKLGLEY